ncbi:hypothetical protein ELI_0077 [Eubacterium callanderi]|uniref:Uncharacterized protein n=1 Tax=Eubacterium callanderi TaxID=53442 RepID=E3GHE4_9FIRM|nr:hypothetical protein ELI_0077 [Eubacterium callanderi]
MTLPRFFSFNKFYYIITHFIYEYNNNFIFFLILFYLMYFVRK